jgi:ABC-2 type transport system ATP-binding protein
VDGVTFSVDEGEVFALIGSNGAGKTTTLRMVATLLRPSEGDATVDGHSVTDDPDRVRERITYLPDEAGAYKNMTGVEYLRFMAGMFSTDAATVEGYVRTAVEASTLGERIHDRVSTYSRGMVRKLLLSRAVMTRPRLAILDEATSGLDVLNALDVRKMVRRLAHDEGMAFLLSSHNMLEIEYVSDRVGIMAHGNLMVTGTPQELKRRYGAPNLEEVFERVVVGSEVL